MYDPGDKRVEIYNAGTGLALAPDWKPVDWSGAERRKGPAWSLKTIESLHTHGTPPLPTAEQASDAAAGDDMVAGGIGS